MNNWHDLLNINCPKNNRLEADSKCMCPEISKKEIEDRILNIMELYPDINMRECQSILGPQVKYDLSGKLVFTCHIVNFNLISKIGGLLKSAGFDEIFVKYCDDYGSIQITWK